MLNGGSPMRPARSEANRPSVGDRAADGGRWHDRPDVTTGWFVPYRRRRRPMSQHDDEDDRLDDAVDDMSDHGTSLDDAAEEYGADRDELSEAFGEEMEERYGDEDE